MAKDTVLVFCAHNDDQIIGVGGTLAKYVKEGIDVITVIFSYGELSLIYLKREIAVKTRVKESKSSDKIFGLTKTYYLGLKEGKFKKEFNDRKLKKNIKSLISENNPSKIFIHSSDDPHPDHRAVHEIIMSVLGTMGYKGSIYSYDVWNLVNIAKRNHPKLVVDITKTFRQKVEAFKAHKSQKFAAILPLLWSVYFRARLNGILYHTKYAEVFYKLK